MLVSTFSNLPFSPNNSSIGNSTKKDQRTAVDADDDGDSGTGSVDCLISKSSSNSNGIISKSPSNSNVIISKSPPNSNGTTMVVVHVDPLSGTEVIDNL